MFERDLQSARTSRNRLDDILEQFQREEDSLSQAFDPNQRDVMQRAREELSFRRQTIKDRLSRKDEEIILLENRIMEMQSQIDSVESFVQKNLEF
jgi:chromosome segregation ATPase